MHPTIAQHRSGISAICERYRIRRLEVFGSAARADDFDPESSDADFLVGVEPGAVRNPYLLAQHQPQPRSHLCSSVTRAPFCGMCANPP